MFGPKVQLGKFETKVGFCLPNAPAVSGPSVLVEKFENKITIPNTDVVPIFSNTKSFLFDGVNEIIQGPASSVIAGVSPSAITFSSWIKTTDTANRYIQSIKRINASASSLFSMRVIGADRIGLVMRVGTPPGGTTFVQPQPLVPGGLTDGLWHHCCGTWDGTGWEVFVDGVSVGADTTALLTLGPSTVNPYTVGGFNNGFGSLFFNGNIDEPMVFGGATKFTLAEAQEIYNGGVPISPLSHSRSADLLSWYRMGDDPLDDGTGTTGRIVDQISSPTNDGTPINTEAGDIVEDTP